MNLILNGWEGFQVIEILFLKKVLILLVKAVNSLFVHLIIKNNDLTIITFTLDVKYINYL